jgi:hypothetical protein
MTENLVKLLERLSSDDEFRKKVMADKQSLAEALSEMGWSPEASASFELKAETKGYWGCGTQCGCAVDSAGQGCSAKAGHNCTSGKGYQIK